ncbi:hypothetical protein BHYA_0414g00020 [Botrytis hyacinthi]|uniref:Helicase C-terminal domain-containing protein n=1 Tax=Botrytis hyacinthi TaxID=278943 RepID=A0A4Z1G424_9HELO|nr:hypothetical protein BHYA_0414g00020 [Botrytis hyacinthi]
MPFESQIQPRSFYLETYPDGPTPPKSSFSTYGCYIGLGADSYSFIDDLTSTFLSSTDFKPECVNFKAIAGKEQLQKIIQEFRVYIQLHHPQGIINFNNIESINSRWVNSALGALIRRNGGKTKRREVRNKSNLAAVDSKPLTSSQPSSDYPGYHFKATSAPLTINDLTICVHVLNKPLLIHRDVLSTYRTPVSQGKVDTTLDIHDLSLTALFCVLQNPEECAINFDPSTQSLFHISSPDRTQNLEFSDGIEIKFQGSFRFVVQKSLSNGQKDIYFVVKSKSLLNAPSTTSGLTKTTVPQKDAIPNSLPNPLANKAQGDDTGETDVREYAEDQFPPTNSPRALVARRSLHPPDATFKPYSRKRAKFSKASTSNSEYEEVSDEGNIDGAGNNENGHDVAADDNYDAEDSGPIERELLDYNKVLALELEKDVGAPPVRGDGESEDEFLERERDYQELIRNQRTLKMQRQLESKVCEQLSEETWLETCRVLRHDHTQRQSKFGVTIRGMSRKLLPCQAHAVVRTLKLWHSNVHNVMHGHAMGIGKTTIAIATCHIQHLINLMHQDILTHPEKHITGKASATAICPSNDQVNKKFNMDCPCFISSPTHELGVSYGINVILSPPSLLTTWRWEHDKCYENENSFDMACIIAHRSAGLKSSHPLEDVYKSMSYDSYVHNFFSETKKQEYTVSSLWKDECHKEKGLESPTIQLIKRNDHLNDPSVHLNPMSGTMITNGPNDIVEYLRWMRVDEWEDDASLASFDVDKLRSLGKEWDSKLKSNKVEESSDIFKKVIKGVQPIIEATTLRFTPETNFLGTGPVVTLPPNYHSNIPCQHPLEWKEEMNLYNQGLDREYNAKEQKHRQAWKNKHRGGMDGYQPLSRQNTWLYYMARQYSNFPGLKGLHKLDGADTPYRLTEKEWQEHPVWRKEDDSRNAHNLNFRDEPDLPLSKSSEPYRRHLDVIVKSSNKLEEIRKKIDKFPNKRLIFASNFFTSARIMYLYIRHYCNVSKEDVIFVNKLQTAKEQGDLLGYWHGDVKGEAQAKASTEPHVPRYMVAQCSAFAVGLTLNEAYAVGLLEPSYDAAQELQAFSRHSRMGNKEKKTETWLFYNVDDEKELALIERNSKRDSMRAGLDPTHKQKMQLRGGEPESAIHLD